MTTTDIFALSDQAVERAAAIDPMNATFSGVNGQDHRWPDLSPDGQAAANDEIQTLRREAAACQIESPRESLAQRVLLEWCDGHLGLHATGEHLRDLNNIVSPPQQMRAIFDVQQAETVEHWEAIIERLGTIDEAMDRYQQSLAYGVEHGTTASRRQVTTVIGQAATNAGDTSSFEQLRAKLDNAGIATPELHARLDGAIATARSTYARFGAWLTEEYLDHATPVDAAGPDRYATLAQTFLGTELDLHETYEWGWSEVERLWSELQSVCASIDPDQSVAGTIDMLMTDPDRAATSVDEFIDIMKQRQDVALANLDGTHFDIPEQIRRIEVHAEAAGGALAAHYVGPSEDFSRAGSVWYPIAGQSFFPLFREITIAYHEGFPGHHLQVGVQNAMGDELSRFHRMMVWYPGSGEGWALYAEHLMGELGYFEKPDYVAGLLSSQLFRACRVAIDIGLHLGLSIPDHVTFHPGQQWSYELAFELLTTRGLESPAHAHSELVRYLGWPSQAISYKVGEKAILDLRSDHQARAGFDLKEFHSAVLSAGSVGLDLLADHIA